MADRPDDPIERIRARLTDEMETARDGLAEGYKRNDRLMLAANGGRVSALEDALSTIAAETKATVGQLHEVREANDLPAPRDEDVWVKLGADSVIADEARHLDWGVLVVEQQGGVSAFVVGLDEKDAAALLRTAADALDAP